MRKRVWIKIVLILAAVVLTVGLSACVDIIDRPDDYVEVESLRIDQANVYLSPTGETAKKKLNVTVLPSNATNKALKYYVPSEYLSYVEVSEDGVLTASQLTPEGVKVPVKVHSTTNPKASLIVNVIVENVEVERIYFDVSSISMMFNSEGQQLNVLYYPTHALDGRAVSYTSFREDIVTVSDSGWVTPVGAGNTTVTAEGRTSSGQTITGYIQVEVKYAKGRYRLEVSDATPRYNQVLGDFKDINFTVMILDDNSDPDVDISWYVGTERVIANQNNTQFKHRPAVDSRTTYKISVRIKTRLEAEQTLESESINIYNPFVGYEYKIYNQNGGGKNGYQYGDTVTFPLTESQASAVKYLWYLKPDGGLGKGIFVGETTATDKNLTRRINTEGNFILTAYGLDIGGSTIYEKSFPLSVVRYVLGDTVLLEPMLLSDSIPPESFNYFLYSCDEDGNKLTTSESCGYSLNGEVFEFRADRPGYYLLASQAMLNGIVATVKVDGKETPFTLESSLIRVYSPIFEDDSHLNDLVELGTDAAFDYASVNHRRIDNVQLGGRVVNGVPLLEISWDNVRGNPAFFLEIVLSDGTTILLDSAVDTTVFSYNKAILPQKVVGFGDKFKFRIKQKGSAFTQYYSYGYATTSSDFTFASIDSAMFRYFSAYDGQNNFYFNTVDDVAVLLGYLASTRPSGNPFIKFLAERIDGTDYATYTFRALFDFDFLPVAGQYPPISPDISIAPYDNVFSILLSAQWVCGVPAEMLFRVRLEEDGAHTVTLLTPVVASTVLTTSPVNFVGAESAHFSATPYGSANTEFAIDKRQEYSVGNSYQLYRAAEDGYKPYFTNDGARLLYQKARTVINTIIGYGMTDYEKVLAIYDYLASNVIYDTELAQKTGTLGVDTFRYAGFRLEGVFDYKRAVCEGLSQAFVLLCAIEGIPSVRVTGQVNGASHAWNKVLIHDVWYNVDVTNAQLRLEDTTGDKLYPSHRFFLLSDADYGGLFETFLSYGDTPVCAVSRGYYGETYRGNALTIRTLAELEQVIDSVPHAHAILEVYIAPNLLAEYENLSALLNSAVTTVNRTDGNGFAYDSFFAVLSIHKK